MYNFLRKQEEDEKTESSVKEDDSNKKDDSNKRDDSEKKEIEAPELPLFEVEVQEAVKRGENVVFTLHSTIPSSYKGYVVLRKFEDFEWLHHNLVTANNIDGVIVSLPSSCFLLLFIFNYLHRVYFFSLYLTFSFMLVDL